MLTKEQFVNIITCIQEYESFLDKILKYICLEKFDELLIPGKICDLFFNYIYNEETVDIINQWLYENGGFNAEYEEIEEFFDEYLND